MGPTVFVSSTVGKYITANTDGHFPKNPFQLKEKRLPDTYITVIGMAVTHPRQTSDITP